MKTINLIEKLSLAVKNIQFRTNIFASIVGAITYGLLSLITQTLTFWQLPIIIVLFFITYCIYDAWVFYIKNNNK